MCLPRKEYQFPRSRRKIYYPEQDFPGMVYCGPLMLTEVRMSNWSEPVESNRDPGRHFHSKVDQGDLKEHLSAHKTNNGNPDKLAALNQQKRRKMMARLSLSLVTLTFLLLLSITVFMNPLCETHGSKSMLLSLLATFIFLVFGSAVSVMITVDA